MHSSFKIADPTAIGENPVREIVLDVVPVDETSSIISLAWKDSAEKVLEKTTSTEEAQHTMQLISTDLAQLVKLTSENKYDEAKEVMKNMLKTYSQDTSTPTPTNLPALHNTQADLNDETEPPMSGAENMEYYCPLCKNTFEEYDVAQHKGCPGKLEVMNENTVVPAMTEEEHYQKWLQDQDEQTNSNQLHASEDIDADLWKQAGQVKLQNIFPSGTVQNLTFESTEELNDYQAKQKGAAKPEGNVPLWDQEGKDKAPKSRDGLVAPSLSYEDVENQKEEEHENMKDHIDETIKKELESALQEKAASVFGPEQVELVKVLRENGRNWDEIKKMLTKDFHFDKDAVIIFVDQQRQAAGDEGVEIKKEEPSPLKPPENLVSPETHDKLLEDLKKDKEPEIEKVDEPIVEESAQEEKCPGCGHMKPIKGECPGCKRCDCEQGHVESTIEEISRADNSDIRKVAGPVYCKHDGCRRKGVNGKQDGYWCDKHVSESKYYKEASVKSKVASYMRIPETDSIVKVALELWKYPSNYMGDDLSDYYKGPAKGYDADALDKSNFKVALEMLGGEGNGVLVGSFGGFGGGHEQIFVHKDAADKVAILQDIENKLTGYPVLDDSDYSEAQMEEEQESYDSWAKPEALRIIDEELHRQNPDLQGSVSELELTPDVGHLLASVVFSDLSYGDGSALDPKHLLQEAEEAGLLNSLRNQLSGTEVVPEDPRQMKLFESSLRSKLVKNALKKRAVDDVNPLQEPISEEPTMETPSQDVIPFGKAQHRGPKPESWVIVQSDLKGELPAFRAKFVSEETDIGDGTKWGIVDKDGELLKVEMHRITPETEGAQTADPIAEPQIEAPKEIDVPVIPSLDSLHSASSLKEAGEGDNKKCPECDKPNQFGEMCSGCEEEYNRLNASQDDLLTIKAEAEQLLKDVEGMSKTSYMFIKKGLEKHADDSAFEGNGWCRVWVQEDEVATSSKYSEILKIADESARIAALKEVARELAHEALRLADSAGAKVGVQSWFEALKPSDHDRIDWVSLANPQAENVESSLKQADNVMDTKCEECGEPLGPEVFLSKWPVCGKCTRKRHKKVTGSIGKEAIKVEFVEEEGTQGSLESLTKFLNSKFRNQEQMEMQLESLATEWAMANGYTMSWAESESSDGGALRFTKNSTHVSPDWKPKQASLNLKASDFEKGISQNKTADEPAVEPKTLYKDLKKAPAGVDREKAVPAPPELDVVLAKMDALERNLATLDDTKKQIQAKMKEEIAKLEQSSERVQMEAELQESINKAGVLIEALESKVVSWRDKIYVMQNQEVSYVPNITPKEMLSKIYAKFEGAEKFVEAVLSGMKSQAVNVLEKTLVKFPGKKSSMDKKASVIDQWNEELLAALKELSSPL